MEAKRAKRTQFPVVPGRMGTQRSGTRHKCAKRTQFPGRSPVGRGHRGVGRGANMRNEPNLAGRSRRPSLASPPSGLAPAKSIMQNKPNFRWSAKTPRPDCAKQSQFPPGPGGTRSGGRGQTCETNPICPAGLGGPPSPLPPGLAPAKSIMKNKPNSWRSARPQERIVQNEANLPGGARWDGVWGTMIMEAIVQNEPNFWRCRAGQGSRSTGRGGKCVKRSQFRRESQV